jgi:hypothetical protein
LIFKNGSTKHKTYNEINLRYSYETTAFTKP